MKRPLFIGNSPLHWISQLKLNTKEAYRFAGTLDVQLGPTSRHWQFQSRSQVHVRQMFLHSWEKIQTAQIFCVQTCRRRLAEERRDPNQTSHTAQCRKSEHETPYVSILDIIRYRLRALQLFIFSKLQVEVQDFRSMYWDSLRQTCFRQRYLRNKNYNRIKFARYCYNVDASFWLRSD